jgi:3-hydroxyacyl-CoA dehydrogenase
MTQKVRLERDGYVGVVVIDNPPVNAGSGDVRAGLLAAITAISDDTLLVGGVLIGAGRSFIAGSDLREFDLPLSPPQLPDVITAIESSPKPFVAALHGAALGGGYELALACDARIAAPDTVVGLPETGLGIIPGAGGTVKLPRLVGTAQAISLICSGTRVPALVALKLGMIDAIAQGDLRAQAVARVQAQAGMKARVIDRPVPVSDSGEVEQAAAQALKKGRNRPHIIAAINHIRAAETMPVQDALRTERATFSDLRISAEARALRHIFFAERSAARGRADRQASPFPIKIAGVVGAGTMGSGIAIALLLGGVSVVLVDTNAMALERAKTTIAAALETAEKAGKLPAGGAKSALLRLTLSQDLHQVSRSDLVVEAIIEDMDAKCDMFKQLGQIAPDHALLASNTSYLDLNPMAQASNRPAQVLGLHFFSPAHVMKLVEVIAASATSDQTMATGLALVRKLGKQPVEAGNAFGFIGNRIYAAYRKSCEFMLEDGALPQEIDAALEAFGFAMGPFAVADMSGLDIAWRMRQSRAHLRNSADRYVHIPDQLCEAGRFGRKTGAGYYRYDAEKGRQIDPFVEALVKAASQAKGITRREIGADEIIQRSLAAIVNEAGLLLGEGIAMRASDIDVVLVNGYGFPRWRGGPLHWAAQQDQATLQSACAAFSQTAGPSCRTADLNALRSIGADNAPTAATR